MQLPEEYSERAAYVASGSVEVSGIAFSAGQMLVFRRGVPAHLSATTSAVVMLVGGEPVGVRSLSGISSRRLRSVSNRQRPTGVRVA